MRAETAAPPSLWSTQDSITAAALFVICPAVHYDNKHGYASPDLCHSCWHYPSHHSLLRVRHRSSFAGAEPGWVYASARGDRDGHRHNPTDAPPTVNRLGDTTWLADAAAHWHAFDYPNAVGHHDGHGDEHADQHAHPDAYADTHRHGDADTDAHADPDTDTYGDRDRIAHTVRDTDCDADRRSSGDGDRDANAFGDPLRTPARMETFALLKQLTESPGPSGDERGIAATVADLWRPLVDEIITDRVGSLLGLKRGAGDQPRPSILLAAHQDELGLMVSRVVDHHGSGFLRVSGLGGVDRRQLVGQLVVVHGREPLTGVLGGLPDSMLPEKERGQAYTYEHLALDVGLPFERVREMVSIGDFVTFRQPLRQLLGGRVAGKALDNRSSIAAVTICLELLQGRRHTWDVIAVATSQEETAYLGAYTSAFAHRPDIAVAIDVGHAKGPGTNDSELPELGSGPLVGMGAEIHPTVRQALVDAAKALEMSVGVSPNARGGGTDAYALQTAREGIPTGLVEIPLRYMHTMVETADINDVERAGRLLAEMIARLDDKFLPDLKEDMMRPDKRKDESQ